MIYGYVSIPYNEMVLAKKQIREIKQKHGYEGELKWTNISDMALMSILTIRTTEMVRNQENTWKLRRNGN